MVAVAGLCSSCSKNRDGAVNAIGSTSIEPFAEMLAQEFNARQKGVYVEVQGGGSMQGLTALASGIADIGMCSRNLTAEEAKGRTAVTIARDGLAVVVHPSNKVGNLSKEQIRRIFSGEICNWKEVGGDDVPIRPIAREEGSGTREAFVNMVMGNSDISDRAIVQESNGAVKELVRNDPGGIGFMSLGLVKGELTAIQIDHVDPTAAKVVAGEYKLVRPFLFVLKGPMRPQVKQFIDFVLSAEGQRMLETEGLVGALQ
jgi:phosphate transport system substrate-binding protein